MRCVIAVMGFVTHLWMSSSYGACWAEAGQRYSIEPELLYAIAQVESNLNPSAVNHNADGSRDIGLMQINSWHLPRLQASGINEQRLLNESCLAVNVGASILADFIKRYGYSWEAVGAYNAGTSEGRDTARLRYAHKVWQRYRSLFARDVSAPKL